MVLPVRRASTYFFSAIWSRIWARRGSRSVGGAVIGGGGAGGEFGGEECVPGFGVAAHGVGCAGEVEGCRRVGLFLEEGVDVREGEDSLFAADIALCEQEVVVGLMSSDGLVAK